MDYISNREYIQFTPYEKGTLYNITCNIKPKEAKVKFLFVSSNVFKLTSNIYIEKEVRLK